MNKPKPETCEELLARIAESMLNRKPFKPFVMPPIDQAVFAPIRSLKVRGGKIV
jgi:hypothetical protein